MTAPALPVSRTLPWRVALSLRPQNDVERNIWRANALAAVVVIGFACLDWVSGYLLDGRPRGLALGDAVARAMLYTGIPHYVIALLFMVTSPANRTGRRRARLTAACLAALALCVLYEAAGGPPLPGASRYLRQLDGGFWARVLPLFSLVAVYVVFLVHEISDETSFLHRAERQAKTRRCVARVLFPGTVAVLAAAGWVATAFGAYDDTLAILPRGTSFALRAAAAVFPLAGVVLALSFAWKRWVRRGAVDVRQVFTDLQPELRICLLTIATISAGLALTARAYWIFLPHFAVWYLVVRQKVPAHAPARSGWWQWVRKTRPGFNVLYISITLAAVLAAAISANSAAFPSDHGLLGGGLFVDWTIFHITVSLLVPRAGT